MCLNVCLNLIYSNQHYILNNVYISISISCVSKNIRIGVKCMSNQDFYTRARNLKESISDYEALKNNIKTGIDIYEETTKRRKNILDFLNSTEEDWKDYRWQLKNVFTNVEDLNKILNLSQEDINQISVISKKYRFSISPYFLSMIDPNNPDDILKKQSIPGIEELDETGELDPMDETGTSLDSCITRRYPDRLIINVTNKCPMFCRHCQRKRLILDRDTSLPKELLLKAIDYIKVNSEIRDVLITGGDALMLSDNRLNWLLNEIRSIKHVEIIRIGTRIPVTMPQRVTKKLVSILKKYHPLYINTQFNHPLEITPESSKACIMLADAGISLGNQMVLLNGINNNKFVVRKLNQELLKIRVKPYYIFHPKDVRGTGHFSVQIKEGIEIMQSLRGYTSGLAIPQYIVNGPKGLGKTPILPQYLISNDDEKAVFMNWQGKTFEIFNKK